MTEVPSDGIQFGPDGHGGKGNDFFRFETPWGIDWIMASVGVAAAVGLVRDGSGVGVVVQLGDCGCVDCVEFVGYEWRS